MIHTALQALTNLTTPPPSPLRLLMQDLFRDIKRKGSVRNWDMMYLFQFALDPTVSIEMEDRYEAMDILAIVFARDETERSQIMNQLIGIMLENITSRLSGRPETQWHKVFVTMIETLPPIRADAEASN